MLADDVIDSFSVVRNRVEFNFRFVQNELRTNNRCIFHSHGGVKIVNQILLIKRNVHRRSGQDVGRPDQNGVSHLLRKFNSIINRRKLAPLWLVNKAARWCHSCGGIRPEVTIIRTTIIYFMGHNYFFAGHNLCRTVFSGTQLSSSGHRIILLRNTITLFPGQTQMV